MKQTQRPPRVMFCQPSPADGYAYDPTPDPDAAACYRALAREDIKRAIQHVLLTASDTLAACVALDALHDALTAIEAEMEAGHAHP